jgi:hypothetical protein
MRRPATYSLPQDIRATAVRTFAYMGGLAVLATLAVSFLRSSDGLAALVTQPEPEWITVDRPHPAFELSMPDFSSSTFDYAIQRRNSDGARKDVLTWGQASADAPYMMVEVYRPGLTNERFIDAPSEIAARIVPFTVTDDVKAAGKLDTKLGPMQLVDFAIAQQGRTHRCLGFVRAFDAPSMQIAGWYCSAGQEVVDRSALGCALDRLTILSAGGDRRLDALFAHAELKRTFCGQRNPILAATPEHEPLMATPHGDNKLHAKLRGRIVQR